MKKYVTLLLGICLVLGLLSGCNKLSTPVNSKDYTSATYYHMQDGLTGTTLYADAKEKSDVVKEQVKYLYVIKQENDWLYGCWGNWFGWVKASDMSTTDDSAKLPLPEFLTTEQKKQFLRATCMFNAYICRNSGLISDFANQIEFDNGASYFRDTAFDTYSHFDATLHSLFTKELLEAGDKNYLEHADNLYIVDAGRGAWGAEVESYTQVKKEKDEIVFNVNLLFKTALNEYRCSLPIEMVKTKDGFRFKEFTSGADDIHWMNTMGNFDPHEGQE